MPLDRVAERLRDILEFSEKIRLYVGGCDFSDFAADSKTVDAVLRNLELIGEAVRHIPKDVLEAEPSIGWQDIRDSRSVFAHDYWAIDDSIVWRIVTDDLPKLEGAVHRLLAARIASSE